MKRKHSPKKKKDQRNHKPRQKDASFSLKVDKVKDEKKNGIQLREECELITINYMKNLIIYLLFTF